MRVLVTGGAGFIGRHLVRRLLRLGHDVAVIDLSIEPLTNWLDDGHHVSVFGGDILDAALLDRAVAGQEVILHQAAIASVARSNDDPRQTHSVNATGTIEVMLAAKRHAVGRVILAGSAAVYGDPIELPCRESMAPAPRSPYGASKLAAEHYVHTLGALLGIETIVLRYFNVFGPGQDPTSEYSGVVSRFIDAALSGGQPVVNGDGLTSRDFVYVDDVVAANLLAMSASGVNGSTVNIATGVGHTLLDLVDAVGAAYGRRLEPLFGPPRPGDVRHSVADISLARELLGYRAGTAFADGIKRTVEWYRNTDGNPGPAGPLMA